MTGAGAFDREGQLALVTGAGAGDAAGNDLRALAEIPPQAGDVLVIDGAGACPTQKEQTFFRPFLFPRGPRFSLSDLS